AEGRFLAAVVGERFSVHGASGGGIERELALPVAVEAVAGAGEVVVAVTSAGAMAREIGGMGGYLIGDDAGLDVFTVGETQVLFRSDVTEHGGSVPADDGSADGGSDVVVAGRDIGY